MCGRFTLTALDLESVASALGVPWIDPELARAWRPRYNVAPTNAHPVAAAGDGRRALLSLPWGLAPLAGGAPITLARAETVASSPLFQGPFRRSRGVVPIDGFFEWGDEGGKREPSWFSEPAPAGGGPGLLFAAGLIDEGRFALITVPASGAVAEIHDRMPALLPAGEVDRYLAGATEAKALPALAAARPLVRRRVSRRVNATKHDDAACLEPAPSGSAWGDLPLFRGLSGS